MPPTFRSSRSGRQFGDGINRTRTGQIDHDVFEGLPIRRWTRQVQTVSQELKAEGTDSEAPGHSGKQCIPEHPMPRDSHLLSPMSRALLRAARAGCIYIRPASKDFEDEEKEATDPEEQQTLQNTERSFSMRKWSTIPKHLEAPEVEFLAKRRPGLPSLYGITAGIVDGANGSVPMRKTRFKKVDPVTGNISVYAAWVPDGHKIEGEITDEAQLITENGQVTVTPEAPAPGTVIEGVGVVNAEGVVVAEAGSAAVITPPRRRPPPPKRKAKGLKGRRKKVMFAPGDGADASLVHGAGEGPGDRATSYEKETDPARMSVDQTTQDDEEDEGEEGEESDEGEGDESGFDAKTPDTPGAQPSTEPELEPTPGLPTEPTPSPVTAATAEARSEPQAPPLPSSLAAVPSEATAPPVVPQPKAADTSQLAASASLEEPTEATPVAPAMEADVEMTDDVPTVRPHPIANSDTQQEKAPELPLAESIAKSPLSMQGAPQDLAAEPSNIAKNTGEPTGEQPAEPIYITMAEPDLSVSEPPKAGPVSMEISTESSQPPQQAQAPGNQPISEQHQQQPSGDNEFDLLGSLEASLNNKPDEIPIDTPNEEIPEQQPGISTNQEAAMRSELARPVQPSTATEETEKPVKQVSLPQSPPESTTQQAGDAPVKEQIPPPAEEKQPEQILEMLAHSETLPSNEPITETTQAPPEQPEERPREPAEKQAPSEGPAPSGTTAEQPVAQSFQNPQDPPLLFASSEPNAERAVESRAESERIPEQPIAAEDPPQDPGPVLSGYIEPAAEHELETKLAQQASGSVPSTTEKAQSK